METAEPHAEARLLSRAAAGDQAAFAELFDRLSPVVLGMLLRTLGDRAEAEEVLQEVFLQVWRQAGRFRAERASVRGWMLMLARSRALDRLRSRRAGRAREEATAAEQIRVSGGAAAPAAGDRLEAVERSRQVREALGGLPVEQRSCIELAFFHGLTQRQIAERLGAPLGTIKSRILLGMKKLRAELVATP